MRELQVPSGEFPEGKFADAGSSESAPRGVKCLSLMGAALQKRGNERVMVREYLNRSTVVAVLGAYQSRQLSGQRPTAVHDRWREVERPAQQRIARKSTM